MNINHYKEQLLKDKKEVSKVIESLQLENNSNNSSGELSGYDNHPADNGTEVYMDEMQSSLRDREKSRLYDINHALNKMKNNTYGICDRCGAKIEEGRLEILPETNVCSCCANYHHTIAENYNVAEKTNMFKSENFYSETLEELSEINHSNTEGDLDNDY